MNISGPAAVAKPEMLFYAPGDLTVTFTLRTYTHATRQKQVEAAQTMGSFMAQVM